MFIEGEIPVCYELVQEIRKAYIRAECCLSVLGLLQILVLVKTPRFIGCFHRPYIILCFKIVFNILRLPKAQRKDD